MPAYLQNQILTEKFTIIRWRKLTSIMMHIIITTLITVQVESTLAMQNLQPKIKAIQERYAGNQVCSVPSCLCMFSFPFYENLIHASGSGSFLMAFLFFSFCVDFYSYKLWEVLWIKRRNNLVKTYGSWCVKSKLMDEENERGVLIFKFSLCCNYYIFFLVHNQRAGYELALEGHFSSLVCVICVHFARMYFLLAILELRAFWSSIVNNSLRKWAEEIKWVWMLASFIGK